MTEAILLDTHVLLWWMGDDRRLGERARNVIADPQTDVLVSAATVWEIAIKRKIGRLDAPDDLPAQLRANRLELLDIGTLDAWEAGLLPGHHRDPFDRMIIAQSRRNEVPIMTADREFTAYDVQIQPC